MNIRIYIYILYFILSVIKVEAQSFTEYFQDKTLRVDYIFSGNKDNQCIFIDGLSQLPQWSGRQNHLAEIPITGNGEIEMIDQRDGKIIYKTSFCTLFQEWIGTDEAKNTSRSFENTYLLPYPKHETNITVSLKDNKGNITATLTHTVKPDDILIEKKGLSHTTPYKYLIKNGKQNECIDIAILAEGYTKEEIPSFYQDAQEAVNSIFTHEPFKRLKNKFNIIAVESISFDSGISSPGKDIWKNTIFNSHFDTFYSERYLTTQRVKDIHNALSGLPYEQIIILANTDQYGGGGIYNAFTLTTAHNKSFQPVVVHEFGHSFAGLADEYYYEEDVFSDTYPVDVEPWEQNITTLVDFKSKWQEMLHEDTPIPTPANLKLSIGVYEGAGYSSKKIFRPSSDCRMKSNTASSFCPVCQRSIEKMIYYYTN